MDDKRKRSYFQKIDRALREEGRRLSTADRAWLDGDGHLEELAEGFCTVDYLANKVLERREYAAADVGEQPAADLAPWVMAKSALIAERAREEATRVDTFRAEHLEGQVLSTSEVESWVESMAERDGPPRMIYEVDLGDAGPGRHEWDYAGEPDREVTCTAVIKAGRYRLLKYSHRVAGEWCIGSRPVTPGGVLDELRLLTLALESENRGWTEASAAAFVLCDAIPVVEVLSGDSGAGWVTVNADAELPPKEVARFYSEVRVRLMGKRVRPVSPSNAELARFVTEHPRMTWRQRWELWQRRGHTEHMSVRSFSKAAQNAKLRILDGPRAG